MPMAGREDRPKLVFYFPLLIVAIFGREKDNSSPTLKHNHKGSTSKSRQPQHAALFPAKRGRLAVTRSGGITWGTGRKQWQRCGLQDTVPREQGFFSPLANSWCSVLIQRKFNKMLLYSKQPFSWVHNLSLHHNSSSSLSPPVTPW